MGILKRPAAAKAKAKPHTKGKPTSHDLIQKVDKDSVKLHGPFALQSYITHMKPQKLVVACTAKQSPDHHKVLVKVLHYFKNSPNCSKQDAVEKRDKLLSNIS
jgi:esterase/lipase